MFLNGTLFDNIEHHRIQKLGIMKKIFNINKLLLIFLFTSSPVSASVCFSVYNPVFYQSISLSADFNNDGIDDEYKIIDDTSYFSISQDGIQYANEYQVQEAWALNDQINTSIYGIPTDAISFDADNDGYIDIVAAFGSRIIVRKNVNNGDFLQSYSFISLSDLYGVDPALVSESLAKYGSKLVATDINQDGYQDLAVIHAQGISLFSNDTTGQFSLVKNLLIDDISVKVIDRVYMADLDDDGVAEIVISADDSYIIYLSPDFAMGLYAIANSYAGIETIDYDKDGDLDFYESDNSSIGCGTSFTDPAVYRYWINNGSGVFSEILVSSDGAYMTGTYTVEVTETGSGGISVLFMLMVLMIKILYIRRS